MQSYLAHKQEFDKSLRELVEAGGSKRYNPVSDYIKIGHLRHLATLGFVVENPHQYAMTFEITDAGRKALDDED